MSINHHFFNRKASRSRGVKPTSFRLPAERLTTRPSRLTVSGENEFVLTKHGLQLSQWQGTLHYGCLQKCSKHVCILYTNLSACPIAGKPGNLKKTQQQWCAWTGKERKNWEGRNRAREKEVKMEKLKGEFLE